jgi:hypothetical protein
MLYLLSTSRLFGLSSLHCSLWALAAFGYVHVRVAVTAFQVSPGTGFVALEGGGLQLVVVIPIYRRHHLAHVAKLEEQWCMQPLGSWPFWVAIAGQQLCMAATAPPAVQAAVARMALFVSSLYYSASMFRVPLAVVQTCCASPGCCNRVWGIPLQSPPHG